MFTIGPNSSDREELYHRAECDDWSRSGSGGWCEDKALYRSERGAHTLPLLAGVMHRWMEFISGTVGMFHANRYVFLLRK